MALPAAVNDQITDAVTQTEITVQEQTPAQAAAGSVTHAQPDADNGDDAARAN